MTILIYAGTSIGSTIRCSYLESRSVYVLDIEHDVTKVIQGFRLVLTYSLVFIDNRPTKLAAHLGSVEPKGTADQTLGSFTGYW